MKNRPPMNCVVSLLAAAVMMPLLNGCSASDEKNNDEKTESAVTEDHAWKTQTDALEKAQQVEQVLQDSELERKRKIDEAIDP